MKFLNGAYHCAYFQLTRLDITNSEKIITLLLSIFCV